MNDMFRDHLVDAMPESERDKLEELTADFMEQMEHTVRRVSSFFAESILMHVPQQEIRELEKIPNYSEATSEGYHFDTFKEFARTKLEEFFKATELRSVKGTKWYSFLRILLMEKIDLEDYFTIDKLMEKVYQNQEWYISSDFHKRAVYQAACSLVLNKKNITLNTAIQRVLKKEKDGIPAYSQEYGDHTTQGVIEELKDWANLLTENDDSIVMFISMTIVQKLKQE